MPDTVLNALKNKLERYEAAGMPAEVKRVKARIAELESAPANAKAPVLPMTLSPTQVVTTTTTVKPTVQKSAPKKAAARKKK